MAKPLLYSPPPSKLLWGAFACTAVIYAGAVLAAMKKEAPPVDLSQIPVAEISATLEQPQEQPTPPPEDIPLPPPPPEPDVQPEFHEETTPPPRQNRPAAPIKAPQQAGPPRTMSISGAKALAVFKPQPAYPYEARAKKLMGSGVCVVSVDVASGNVTDATMAKSIGSPILDNAAMAAFKHWRFQPGKCAPKVQIPITYTMTGASY